MKYSPLVVIVLFFMTVGVIATPIILLIEDQQENILQGQSNVTAFKVGKRTLYRLKDPETQVTCYIREEYAGGMSCVPDAKTE